ncbi:MAG: phosphoribosylglycinamide formyltransferase [Clostridiales bacterium]|nr:phosphoribosylglycinamide formyltransferase [Clostridiales bacterium]
MLKARIAVLVSGGGTNLQALIDAQKSGILTSGEIVLVISNKAEAYALTRAKEAGIETAVFTTESCGTRARVEECMLALLKEKQVDLVILAGLMMILSEDFVKQFPRRMLNVHPSLIPAFCGDGFYGLRVHKAVLDYGVKLTGATVHFVNEVTDGGEIIMQKAVAVKEGDTPEILQRRVMEEAEWKLLPAAAEKVAKEIINERI